jgi:hypothetical protein
MPSKVDDEEDNTKTTNLVAGDLIKIHGGTA